jgi:hypothetical protein
MSEFHPGGAREVVRGDFGYHTEVKRLPQDFSPVDATGAPTDPADGFLIMADHGSLTGLNDITDHNWALPKAGYGGLGADVPTHSHTGSLPLTFAVDITLLTNNTNASGTIAVNRSGVYIQTAQDRFRWDGTFQPITHFRIYGFMQSSEVGETVTLQLAADGTPGTPLSAAGADLVVTNTAGEFTSGWIALATTLITDAIMVIGKSGSNATVDLSVRHLHIALKYAP